MARYLRQSSIEMYVDAYLSKLTNTNNLRKERPFIDKAIKMIDFFFDKPCCDDPVNEVQSVIATGGSAGDFTLIFSGQTTAAIAYDADAAAVQAALEALPNVAPGDVAATGGPLPGTAVVLTFGGAYAATDVPAITVGTENITGGNAVVSQVTQGVAGSSFEVEFSRRDNTLTRFIKNTIAESFDGRKHRKSLERVKKMLENKLNDPCCSTVEVQWLNATPANHQVIFNGSNGSQFKTSLSGEGPQTLKLPEDTYKVCVEVLVDLGDGEFELTKDAVLVVAGNNTTATYCPITFDPMGAIYLVTFTPD